MTPAERKAINAIMSRLDGPSMEVFTIATQAIMQADPEAYKYTREAIREGLKAAIAIAEIYEKMNVAN